MNRTTIKKPGGSAPIVKAIKKPAAAAAASVLKVNKKPAAADAVAAAVATPAFAAGAPAGSAPQNPAGPNTDPLSDTGTFVKKWKTSYVVTVKGQDFLWSLKSIDVDDGEGKVHETWEWRPL